MSASQTSETGSKTKFSLWWHIFRLGQYKPVWPFVAVFVVGLTSWYLLPLLPGLITREILDNLTNEAAVGFNIWTLLAYLIAARLARQVMVVAAVASELSIQEVIATLLRKNLLRTILRYPGAKALPGSSGEAIGRLRDDVDAIPAFLSWSFDPFGQALVMVIGLVVLARINGMLTLAVVLPLIISIVVVNQTSQLIQRYHRENQQAIANVTGLLGDVFGMVQAIKVACTEQYVVQHLDKLNEARRKAALQNAVLAQFLDSFFVNMANIGVGVILLVVSQSLHTQSGAVQLTVGDFAIFVSYLEYLSFMTSMAGGYLRRYKQASVSLERLVEMMPETDETELVAHGPVYLWGDTPKGTPLQRSTDQGLQVLTAKGISYRYPETGRGIEDISFEVVSGSFVVVTGRIGSGKTTLLQVLMGLLPRDAGEVYWNGELVADPANFFVPPHSAYTPQVPRLFSESLRDNILMGIAEDQADLAGALDLAVLQADVAGLDNGLETQVGPRGVKLSGGQVQRAAAARMFVRRPELLVFDDLSSALDVETERNLWENVFAQRAATCLVVSHRRPALQRADQIIVLKGGKIEAIGQLEELLQQNEEMQLLWKGDLDAVK